QYGSVRSILTANRLISIRIPVPRISALILIPLILSFGSRVPGPGPGAFWPGAASAPDSPANRRAGYDAWLRYEALVKDQAGPLYGSRPAVSGALDDTSVIESARNELLRGLRGTLGRTLRLSNRLSRESAFVLGKLDTIKGTFPGLSVPGGLKEDGYLLKTVRAAGESYLIITAPSDRGVLYGAFALLRKIALREPGDSLDESQNPYAPVRMVNQWDNLDGTIERGYAGPSIFFE